MEFVVIAKFPAKRIKVTFLLFLVMTIGLPILVVLLLLCSLLAVTPFADGSNVAMGQSPLSLVIDDYYESPSNAFVIKLPDRWAIEDLDSATDPPVIHSESYPGFEVLAKICTEEAALPGIGGTQQCQSAEEAGSPTIYIMRFSELKSNPQFAGLILQNKTIATLDLLPLHLQAIETFAGSGRELDLTFKVEEESIENRTVQVSQIDPQTNQAVLKHSVPAKFVEVTYRPASNNSNPFFAGSAGGAKVFSLYVLSEDTNTGYAIFSPGWPETTQSPIPRIREIIDSFGLLRPSPN